MKKLILRGGLVLIALVIVGVVVLFFSLNGIIKSVVETQGTKATGVATTLDSVNLNPFGGALALNQFDLANPEGFSDAKLFSFGEADVQIKIGSMLGGDEVVVPKFNLDGATVLIELKGLDLNSIKLLEQIQENAKGKKEDTGAEPTDDEPAAEGEAKGFVIKELNITNTKVLGRINVPGVGEQDINLTLADIQKTDVRGVDLSDVIAFTLETVLINASKSVSDVAPNLEALEGQLDTLADNALGDIGAELDKAVPGLGGAAQELGGKEVGKALDGLFGGKKKDAEPAE
ncbi:MAG: hypothetical protein AAGA25_00435 [Planctomycetota bacterium]